MQANNIALSASVPSGLKIGISSRLFSTAFGVDYSAIPGGLHTRLCHTFLVSDE